MKAFFTIGSSLLLLPLSRTTLSVSRNRSPFPKTLVFFFSRANSDGPSSSGPNPFAAEREEAKAALTSFLKKNGLSNVVAAITIKKVDLFIDDLVSRLRSVHESRYLVEQELTTLEIRDVLIPYIETLVEEHGDNLVKVAENFPKPHVKERSFCPSKTTLHSKKLKAVARVSEIGPSGKLPPHIGYLMMEFGMELDQVKRITQKFPAFSYYSLEGKVKPVVQFLVDLGLQKSDIPKILQKRPQLCGFSLSEKLIPTMAILENLGVDKKQWAKVIHRCPDILTHSRQKLKANVDFLHEMGLSGESVGKILTLCPSIISNSVGDKLRPTAEYFRSLGVDVAVLLHRSPQTFGLSIEANLKPITQFFVESGFDMREIGTMISKFGGLYNFSLAKNLKPKWEFFLTMDYPKEELVRFPQYFGYSLEGRIKPRFAALKANGVRLFLNHMLSRSNDGFEEALKRKMKNMVVDKSPRVASDTVVLR